MLNPIQEAIDSYLRSLYLPDITDIRFFENEGVVLIIRDRSKGRMNVCLDVSNLSTASEVVERVFTHPVVEAEKFDGRWRVRYA